MAHDEHEDMITGNSKKSPNKSARKMPTSPEMLSKNWSKTVDQLWQELHSSPKGLSEGEAQQVLEKVGPNVLKAHQELSPLILFLNQFKSPIVLILIFASIMTAFLQDWTDGIIMMLIVLGCAIISFGQEYNANSAVGFKLLNLQTLGRIAGIVIANFISVELVKRWFYKRFFA